MKVELGPLPEPWGWFDIKGSAGDGFTADQMRAYAQQEVAKERERCAKLCEMLAEDGGAETRVSSDRDIALLDCAEAIRKGTE